MPILFSFEPPLIDVAKLVHGLVEIAETAGAEVLLAASQPLVPVEHGDLRDSGHVEHDGHGAAVVYSATNEADGFNYAAKQHEDESLNHPNGGGAHYLSDPMRTERGGILAAMAAKVRL
jgi:hypothetical protein